MKKVTSSGKRCGKPQRVYEIAERLLKDRSPLVVTALADYYGVSRVQIRDDLEWINRVSNLILLWPHGGVTAADARMDSWYETRTEEDHKEKQSAAAFAVQYLIKNGDQLLLDSGTQMEAFVHELVSHARKGLTVISAAANFSKFLLTSPDIAFIQLGGVLNPRALVFLDASERFSTETFFENANRKFFETFCYRKGLYKAVITGTAITHDSGLAVNTKPIISNKQAIINAANELIILLSPCKFRKVARETVTQCGLRPETSDWLNSEKPATIVIDASWGRNEEPPEFARFISDKNIVECSCVPSVDDRKYRNIRTFKTRLIPQQSVSPA